MGKKKAMRINPIMAPEKISIEGVYAAAFSQILIHSGLDGFSLTGFSPITNYRP
jgi:hypothetical protein